MIGADLLSEPSRLLSEDGYRAFDWLESAKFRWWARERLLQGELPLWNPFLEGGMPSYAHPSDPSLSPFFVTALLFGPLLSMKVDAAVLLLLAGLGSYLLAQRWLAMAPAAAAFVGVSVASSGWLPSRLAVGFYESLWLCVFPLVAYLLLRGLDQGGPLRGGARCFVAAALLLAAAGIQMQLCLAFAVLQLLLLGMLGPRGQTYGRLGTLSAVSALTLMVALLGAVKFLPMLELLVERGGRDGYYPRELAFLGPLKVQLAGLMSTADVVGSYGPSGLPSAPEYSYVGLQMPAALLALVGLAASGRRGLSVGLLAVVTLLLSWRSGDGLQLSLFEPLSWLPLFSSVRDTARYVPFFLLLWLSLLAGLGVQVVLRRLLTTQGSLRALLLYSLVLLTMVPGAIDAARVCGEVFSESLTLPTERDAHLRHVRLEGNPSIGSLESRRAIYLAPLGGEGVLYEPEDLPPRRPSGVRPAAIISPSGERVAQPGYGGELRVLDGAARLSPLQLDGADLVFFLRADQATVLELNHNYHRGWRAPAGLELFDSEGLLGLRTRSSWDGEVQLQFAPRMFWIGGSFSLLGLALAGLLCFVGVRRD